MAHNGRFREMLPWVARWVGVVLFSLALGGLTLWSLVALWFLSPIPDWLRIPMALLMALSIPTILWQFPRRKAVRVLLVGILAVLLLRMFQTPSNDRNWSIDQERMPRAWIDGDRVRIENLRYTVYRTTDDYDVTWYEDQFDLTTLETVDFLVEPFSVRRGPAHTFLTFGFADGRHVAISVEIRKEQAEEFSAIKGLFRQYELTYVAGDERDLIGLRANVREHDVYLYPIRATSEQIRHLFEAMLIRANRLHDRPEFYNTLTNTCSTNIVRHFEQITDTHLPADLRIVLPGHSDALAHDLGLIDFDGTLEEARQRFQINQRSTFHPDPVLWSRQIRLFSQSSSDA